MQASQNILMREMVTIYEIILKKGILHFVIFKKNIKQIVPFSKFWTKYNCSLSLFFPFTDHQIIFWYSLLSNYETKLRKIKKKNATNRKELRNKGTNS